MVILIRLVIILLIMIFTIHFTILLLPTMLHNTRILHQVMPSLRMELLWRKSLVFILLIIQLFQLLFTSQTTITKIQNIMLPSQSIIHQSQSTILLSQDIMQSQSMDMEA